MRHYRLTPRLPINWLVIGMVALVVVAGIGYLVVTSRAAGYNVSIDFTKPIMSLETGVFSGSLSTYGQDGGSIAANAKQRTALSNVALGYYRVPLQYNGGNIISSAGGGPTNISGDTWITNIKATGAQPMIVIGGSSDNNFTASDAASMVRHFNGSGGIGGTNHVSYWIIGNEPNNGGMDIASYCTLFNASIEAMKAVDPSIKVGGPAWSYYDATTIQNFLNCAGSKTDIVDYHHYAMGGSYLSTSTALDQTADWENEITAIKQRIAATVPARASQIEVQVGEYNWSWRTGDGYQGYNGDDRFYQAVATVWGASVAGHIARAGGRGHEYSDQNGALGLTFEKSADASHFGRSVDDPMPIYEGLKMFTGGNLFTGFGTTMVDTSTQLANVEVYASTKPKNVVLINKSASTSQPANLSLTGITNATAAVWQTNPNAPFAEPAKISTAAITNGQMSLSLPAYSVTTLVITEAATSPTVTPAPTVAATIGDINGDGVVNVIDLSLLLSHWGNNFVAADFNHDGSVGVVDLSLLLSHWTG